MRVNTISPGNVWTPLWEAGVQSMPDPEKQIQSGFEIGEPLTLFYLYKQPLFVAAPGRAYKTLNLSLKRA